MIAKICPNKSCPPPEPDATYCGVCQAVLKVVSEQSDIPGHRDVESVSGHDHRSSVVSGPEERAPKSPMTAEGTETTSRGRGDVFNAGVPYAPDMAAAHSKSSVSEPSSFPFLCHLVAAREECNALTLEVSLANLRESPFRGTIWITDETGADGPSKEVRLDGRAEGSFFPSFQTAETFSGGLSLRLRPDSSLSAFWETELLLHRTEKSIVISARQGHQAQDDSVSINRMTQNITVNASDLGESRPLLLGGFRFRGPKSIVHSHDAPIFQSSRLRAIVTSRPGLPLSAEINGDTAEPTPPPRITLIHESESAEACAFRTHLFAGSEFVIGRSRTRPDMVTDPSAAGTSAIRKRIPNPFPPADVTLRTLHGTEDASYISSYAFRLSLEDQQTRVHSLSANLLQFQPRPATDGTIQPDCILKPGASTVPVPGFAPDDRLQLQLRRRVLSLRPEHYRRLHDDYSLNVQPIGTPVSVGMTRSDSDKVREDYVFIRPAAFAGTLDNCAWQLFGSGIQGRHACLLWLDDSFWIEPWDAAAFVQVDGLRLRRHQLHRLLPGSHVVLGGLEFSVAESFSQHMLHCGRCKMAKPQKAVDRKKS